MLVIVKGRPIEIDWYIFKGANKQAEDFSQLDKGAIKMFLIGPSNKGDDQVSRFNRFTYEVNITQDANNKQYLQIDIDSEASARLDAGIYDIKVVWVKNSELHLGIREGNQHLSESRISGIFAITSDSEEDNTRLDSGVTAKKILRSFVEPTGYDGLSAYEIAVMHGYTDDEQTWSEEFTQAEARTDYEMDETKAGDGTTTRDDEKHIPVEEWVHESWAHKVEVTWQGNESTRQDNESTRQDNEDTRKTNEGIGTTDAECAAGSRRKNESIRVSNESTRQSQEGTRQDNETTRGQKETARQKAEGQLGDTDPDYATSRVKKELDRQSAEGTRISNEEGRVAAEGSVEGQTGRAYAESVRVSNESTRQSNEGSRGLAETARQKAEGQLGDTDPDYATSRIKQELDRQSAEAARELAETARENAKISSTTIEYAVGDSGTTAPISGWQSTIPSYTTGDFLWGRTTITFGDGTSKVLYAIGSVPDVSVSQNASTGKTTITVGSDSYDVATEPVSVSQNILTIGGSNSGITPSYIININHLTGQPYASFESKDAARNAVTSSMGLRKSGGLYAFLLADGWYVEQYVSTSLIDDAWGSEYNWKNICHELDGKVILISGMGTFGSITGITEKGQYYYNTSSKQLSICISISSPMSGSNFAQVSISEKAIYKYNNTFYNWNGTDLLPILPIIDNAPTSGSTNPVSSGGVKDALDYQESLFEGAKDVLPQNYDTLYVTDFYGNIVGKLDKNGLETLAYLMRSAVAKESGKEGFKICDEQGNVVFKLDSSFGFGDNIKQFIVKEYNKPAVCWVDDDFQIMDGDNVAAEYVALHDWCIDNNIRLDFAYIPTPYASANRITIAQEWLRESFHFLLHPFHDGWFNSTGSYVNTYDLSKVRSSLVDCIKYFRENFFVTGDNILVYPGSSPSFPDIVKLVKEYVDCAIQADYDETNHIANNNRYRLKRYSLQFSASKTKTKVKQELANFIANGDWVILETHIYNYHNDLTTLDETTNSLANVLDVVEYVNGLCPLEPTCKIWRERKFMFEMFNK